MQDAIEGTWSGTVTRADGTSQSMQLVLDYAPPAKETACGNRTLGAATPALGPLCTTESSIALTGSMTIDGELSAASLSGSFIVSGTELNGGFVEVEASQPSPPPDETMIVVNASGSLDGDKLTGQLAEEGSTFELARQ